MGGSQNLLEGTGKCSICKDYDGDGDGDGEDDDQDCDDDDDNGDYHDDNGEEPVKLLSSGVFDLVQQLLDRLVLVPADNKLSGEHGEDLGDEHGDDLGEDY